MRHGKKKILIISMQVSEIKPTGGIKKPLSKNMKYASKKLSFGKLTAL